MVGLQILPWLMGGSLADGGALVWQTPPLWIGAAAAAALVAWLIFALRGGSADRRMRGIELGAWALALIVLVLAAAGPSWVETDGRTQPGKLVVLVDASASMGVLDGGKARADGVDKLLRRLSEEGGEVEVYSFDEELTAGAPTAYDGRGTDLGVALRAVADRNLGQQLRGVVVLTDGLDRGNLRRDLREAAASGTVPASLAPVLPGPLTLYQVGDLDQVQDLSIEDVVSGGFAFLRTPFQLTAQVRGEPGRTVPVTLSREGRLVANQTAKLDENGRAEVIFEVIPREVGRFAWDVSVPVEPDDAVPGNNVFAVVIRVVRDRTRVLQVSGSPSYDQKFLRLFLKEDPSVDLVSFFILRTREDLIAGWRPRELSLIEFPYERLFTEDLSTFDLVVLQNFNYAPYFDHNAGLLLGNLATYVEQGGALVMTGGDRSFDLGDYANTPIAEVLPVKLGVAARKADETPFRPKLTEAGKVHPVTRLGAAPEQTEALWALLPELDGANLTAGLMPGAAVLLEHPFAKASDGTAAPVLAVREVGKGRTMALTIDASWRWSFSEAAVGRGNQAYLHLWKNAMRWLVADPEERRVVVSPSRENVLLGDEVRIVTKVRDAGYGPIADTAVQITVRAPDGSIDKLEARTGTAGEAIAAFQPRQQGAHRVTAAAAAAGTEIAETVFAVTTRDPEMAEILPDGAFLQQLAALYGDQGAFRGPSDRSGPLVDETARRTLPDRRELRLGAAPIVALLFGLLSSLAFWARRRAGGH